MNKEEKENASQSLQKYMMYMLFSINLSDQWFPSLFVFNAPKRVSQVASDNSCPKHCAATGFAVVAGTWSLRREGWQDCNLAKRDSNMNAIVALHVELLTSKKSEVHMWQLSARSKREFDIYVDHVIEALGLSWLAPFSGENVLFKYVQMTCLSPETLSDGKCFCIAKNNAETSLVSEWHNIETTKFSRKDVLQDMMGDQLQLLAWLFGMFANIKNQGWIMSHLTCPCLSSHPFMQTLDNLENTWTDNIRKPIRKEVAKLLPIEDSSDTSLELIHFYKKSNPRNHM